MPQARETVKRARPAVSRWALVAQDIATGFMSTSRLIVTLVGCVTLVAVAFVATHDQARTRFAQQVPALFAGWSAEPTGSDAPPVIAAVEPQARPAVAASTLDPEQANVTRYLSRRYRVADEAVRVLVAAAYRAAETHRLDPLLILAVMAVESSMNPFAESSMGAQGLMQVMTRVHTERFEPHGGDQAALDPVTNIMVGSAILKELIRRGGSVERGLQLYVGAGNLPNDGGYGARVLAERTRIELAASGAVQAAIDAGWRADSRARDVRAVSLAPIEPATTEPAPEAAPPVPKA